MSEISDIKNKPKSRIDRTFRAGMMLTATLGAVAGAVALVALIGNPFTGPIVGVIAGVLLVAGVTKAAKMISTTACKMKYGIVDPDIYIPSEDAENMLGKENAQKIGEYFKNEIIKVQQQLDTRDLYDGSNTKTLLEEKLINFRTTWYDIQKGKTDLWKELSKDLYLEQKKKIENEQFGDPEINEVTAKLVEIVKIPTAEKSALAPTAPETKGTLLSFHACNDAVKQLNTNLALFREMDKKIRHLELKK